jgi:HK97 family phage major capsid protein
MNPIDAVQHAIVGSDAVTVELLDKIGSATTKLGDIAEEMGKAKTEDTARWASLNEERKAQADVLTKLEADYSARQREAETQDAIDFAKRAKADLAKYRDPSKAAAIGQSMAATPGNERGAFILGVAMQGSRDAQEQAAGKAILAELGVNFSMPRNEATSSGKAIVGTGGNLSIVDKATLGLTDATGGFIIPNNLVDSIIKPALWGVDVPQKVAYRRLVTVREGVDSGYGIDIPVRTAAPARAVVAAWGDLKENVNLAYGGYTATMYTLARIYDLAKQFVRRSAGAAEQDVLEELASGFARGEAYYISQGSGSSEPRGVITALGVVFGAYTTAHTAAAGTIAGTAASAIATAAGALAGRNRTPSAAVFSASGYWTMIASGSDTAGFFFNPAGGPTAISGVAAGTLVSPFGIPVYYDPDFPADDLVVGDWKALKVYFGEGFRIDQSETAGTRWDYNLIGFRGEMEMAVDALPAVLGGAFQYVADVLP